MDHPLHLQFLGNEVRTWLIALTIGVAAGTLAHLLYRFSAGVLARAVRRTPGDLDDELVQALRGPVVVLIAVLGTLVGYEQLTLPARVDFWMARAFHVALALSITWVVARLLNVLLHRFMRANERSGTEDGEGADTSRLVPAIAIVLKVLVWGLGLVVALNNAGYDVGALLAGIGIGGLAMAMAAKDTLANIFGGITVFVDKPFVVGDRIRVDGHDGVVTEVGIRSTRIRTLEGPVVVVPNHHFTEQVVTNVSAEPAKRVRHELALDNRTPTGTIEVAMDLLRAIVHTHAEDLEPAHVVSIHAFRDSAVVLLFIYHIRHGRDVWSVQNALHLDLLRRFAEAGIQLAYPTTVQYAAELPAR